MKLLCIKNTKRLVKGSIYDVINLVNKNTSTGTGWFNRRATIILNENNRITLSLDNFKMEDGSHIPEINWISPEFKSEKESSVECIIDKTIKSGDHVVCLNRNSKKLIYGKKYKIESVLIKKNEQWGSTWSDIKIKIEGNGQWYSTYNFRKCTSQESREMSLNLLFDKESGAQKIIKGKRKIEYYDDVERERVLISILISSISDKCRNNMSIIDWAIKKTGYIYEVELEDFNGILEKRFDSILNSL